MREGVPRRIRRGNDHVVSILFGRDLNAVQAPLSFGALFRVVETFGRADHGHFDFGAVPSVDVHLAERVFKPDRAGRGDGEAIRVSRAERLFGAIVGAIVGEQRKRQHDRDCQEFPHAH